MDCSSDSVHRDQETTYLRRLRLRRLLYERRIAAFAVLAALPGLVAAGVSLWLRPWSLQSKIIISVIVLIAWMLLTFALLEQIVRPLQTLSNVVNSLREEDYSFRAREANRHDALGELTLEINNLADLLSQQRIQTIEAGALLRRVVDEIDAPIFTFDPRQLLRLVNGAAERLLQQPSSKLLGKTAQELGLDACLNAANATLVNLPYSTPNARWMLRKQSFRQNGVPHTLIVLSDVSRALREEERSAWQRLIRVLGHELNNSLTPIMSIAGSLATRLPQLDLPAQTKLDFQRGLDIIESRTTALHRFMQSYRKLATMPAPNLQTVELRRLIERVAALETRLAVSVEPGPDLMLAIDPELIEQMLINLIRNAVDSALERAQTTPGIRPDVVLRWRQDDAKVYVTIQDNGIGLLNPSNAFVPFYTTKQGGSGVGLALSQQIAEAHEGVIELRNREDVHGCIVIVQLPQRG